MEEISGGKDGTEERAGRSNASGSCNDRRVERVTGKKGSRKEKKTGGERREKKKRRRELKHARKEWSRNGPGRSRGHQHLSAPEQCTKYTTLAVSFQEPWFPIFLPFFSLFPSGSYQGLAS
jgi:hypothetical protein